MSLLKQRPGHKHDCQTLFLPHKDKFVDKTLGSSQQDQFMFFFNNRTFHMVLLKVRLSLRALSTPWGT